MKHVKSILTMVIAVCIMFTGVVTGDTATVYAADTEYPDGMEYLEEMDINNLDGTTITMKPGDTINLSCFRGYQITDQYNWTSSNKTVAKLLVQYAWSDVPIASLDVHDIDEVRALIHVDSYNLTALKPGTAVITAAHKSDPDHTYSFTVKVKAKKMTAKQKKCKRHAWVTTKKATCERPGVRTCKRCKLQKTVPMLNHKYETETKTVTKYATFAIWYCPCGAQFDPRDYGYKGSGTAEDGEISKAALQKAHDECFNHYASCEWYENHNQNGVVSNNKGQTVIATGEYWFIDEVDYDHPWEEETTETRCVYCDKLKEWIDAFYGD